MFGVKKSSFSLPSSKNSSMVNDINAIKQHVAWIEFLPDGEIISANQQFLDLVGYHSATFRASITVFFAALITPARRFTVTSGTRWPLANRSPAFLSASVSSISAFISAPPISRLAMRKAMSIR